MNMSVLRILQTYGIAKRDILNKIAFIYRNLVGGTHWMTSIHTEVSSHIRTIEQWAYEPYVAEKIGKPVVPVFFVRLLVMMLQSYNLPKERTQLFVVAVTLLQMGLDTHEQITLAEKLEADAMLRRQLRVLAGDYYSSLFYQLLAKEGEMAGIQRLAQAIGEINEAKMIHHEGRTTPQQLDIPALQRISTIKSGLLLAVADFFQLEKESWRQVIPPLILQEMTSSIPRTELAASSTEWLEQRWQQLDQAIPQFESSELRRQLQQMITERTPHTRTLQMGVGERKVTTDEWTTNR